jgi:glycosyltransferase involved in cell wall biosynthesis/peptidoglycan/xylan/chitin deacetylase (PgdA/CDA1 family)
VTVICVFLDEAAYIREALESVLAQDFEDYELLLVDDGSSDASSSIARDYAARDPDRIRYMEHPGHENRGISASRNLGVAEARGELIAFIDADDRWRPFKLREQVALMESMPEVDVVGGAVNYWSSHHGGSDRVVPTGHVRNRPVEPIEATLAFYPLGRAHAPSMSDLLFRRSSILKAGGFEEAFRGAYEDQAFLAKFYLESTLFITDRVYSDYRLHAASCMARVTSAGQYDYARHFFLLWFRDYLSHTRRAGDTRIRHALDRALRRAEDGPAHGLRGAIRRGAPAPLVSAYRRSRRRLKALRSALAPGPAILMYHRIAEETFDPWGMAVSPGNFAEQLEWIAHKRTPLPLTEFVELRRLGKLPGDAIAVTFDDGYACNGEVAAPLLERLGIPATIFLSADLIARGREFWWDELERIVRDCNGNALILDGLEIAVGDKWPEDHLWRFGDPPRTPRQLAYRHLWSLLYAKTPPLLEKDMEQLRQQSGVPAAPRKSHRPLSPESIRATRSDLVQFGSHTLSHARLPALTAEDRTTEIAGSIERCSDLTGEKPHAFAYPYGAFDRDAREQVEKAGYLCACAADGGFVRRRSDVFALPRVFVGNWCSVELERHLGRA